MIERILNNRYRVIRILGAGNSGLIYLAADTKDPHFPVCAIRELKITHQNYDVVTRLEFLLAHKPETLLRLTKTDSDPQVLNFFVEERKFYLVEDYSTTVHSSPCKKFGQVSVADPGMLRFQEMLALLGSTGEGDREVSSPEAIVPSSVKNTEKFTNSVEIISKPSQKPGARRILGLILAGGVALIAIAIPILITQSRYQQEAQAFYNRGIAKLKSQDLPGAIGEFNQSIRLNPRNTLALGNRGNAHFDLGEYKIAIEDYSKMIEMEPNNIGAYYNRGLARYELGDWQGTVEDLNQLLRLQPEDRDAYYKRGIAYYQLGNYKLAIADLDRVIKLDPNYSKAYASRGLARSAAGDFQGGMADYTKAIELDPEDGQDYYRRGRGRFSLGDYSGSVEDYDRA
ncbi:protein kinase family protein, partial [Limnofasciculus baicalensis]